MFLSSRVLSECSPACIPSDLADEHEQSSTSSELARARWTVMELFTMDRYQLQQAAALTN